MKIVMRILLLVSLVTGWSNAKAQDVPLEMQGIYSGKMKLTYYESGKPEKSTMLTIITVDASTWQFQVISGSNFTYSGAAACVAPYIFGSASDSSSVIGGRLNVKGKPGKQILSGKLSLGAGPYWALGDITLKARKGI